MAACMQRRAEKGDMLDAGLAFELRQQAAHVAPLDHEGDQSRLLDDVVHRAARDDAPLIDIDDAVAAFGLVHVMGADEHGEPALAQMMDLFPEFAPRLRIDARGRFVEQQQARLMQHAGGKREPLLPAARQFARELVLALRQSEPRQGRVDLFLAVGNRRRCRATNSRFSRMDKSSQKLKRWVM